MICDRIRKVFFILLFLMLFLLLFSVFFAFSTDFSGALWHYSADAELICAVSLTVSNATPSAAQLAPAPMKLD